MPYQGPERNIEAAQTAARNGIPYVPKIGTDGAGANYPANEGVLAVALTTPAYWVDQSETEYPSANQLFPGYTPDPMPGRNPFNPGVQLNTLPNNSGVSNALTGLLPSPAYGSSPSYASEQAIDRLIGLNKFLFLPRGSPPAG